MITEIDFTKSDAELSEKLTETVKNHEKATVLFPTDAKGIKLAVSFGFKVAFEPDDKHFLGIYCGQSDDGRISKGDIVRHFKRDFVTETELLQEPFKYLYYLVDYGFDCETMHETAIYKALYGERKTFVRDKDEFLSETDKGKYPDAVQKYRFEKFVFRLDI